MKPCVLLSSDCGIEHLSQHKHVFFFPDRIVFSEYEIYSNSKEMDTESFIRRVRLDEKASPVMKGATKDDTVALIDKLIGQSFDTFIVILPEKKMSYYKSIIESYMRDKQDYVVYYYNVESILYPVAYLATNIIKMLENDKTLDDVGKFVEFVKNNNGVFLYSTADEKYPEIKKFDYDDDLLKIEGNNNYFYIIHNDLVTTYRVKERIKTIEYYLKMFKTEVENKDIIPFIQYIDPDSLNIKIFRNLIEKLYPKTKYKEIQLSPEAIMQYGKNVCGIGYILKEQN